LSCKFQTNLAGPEELRMELAGLGSIPTLRFVVLYVKPSIYCMRYICLARNAMIVGITK